jgi:hypothetical protein
MHGSGTTSWARNLLRKTPWQYSLLEQRYRDAFTKAMDISRIDAVIFPLSRQFPPINGAHNGGSFLKWSELSVPSGYLGERLLQSLEILGRAWDPPDKTGREVSITLFGNACRRVHGMGTVSGVPNYVRY